MGGGTHPHPGIPALGHQAVEPIRRQDGFVRRHVETEQLVEHRRLDGARVQRRHRGQGVRDVADQRGPGRSQFDDRRDDGLRIRSGGLLLQTPHQRRRPGRHGARRQDRAPLAGELQVGVGVDETGQNADVSEVDFLSRVVAANVPRCPDGKNEAAADVHPAVLYGRRRDGRHPAGAVAGPGHEPAAWRRLPARLRAG